MIHLPIFHPHHNIMMNTEAESNTLILASLSAHDPSMALVDVIGTLAASAGMASYGDGMHRSMVIGLVCIPIEDGIVLGF